LNNIAYPIGLKIVLTTRLRYVLVAIVAAFGLSACASSGTTLNSDRIERAFGSYGVDVLRSDSGRRTSSLFSLAGTNKTTRTYAVVEFAGEPRSAYSREHALIEAGQSIGATFRDAGWSINKQHMYIGEFEVPETYSYIGDLMQIVLPETLATHVYLLNVSKDDRSFSYATITEIHHPAYLDAADLKEIYGEIIFDDSNRDSIRDYIGPPNPPK
jgi:hypothetical protein